jgi:ankyrin repeat protein
MHEDITRFLVSQGADVTARARIGGITPLHCLPLEELKRVGPIATLLWEKGADYGLKDSEGRIPLDTAQAIVEPIIPEIEEGSAQGIFDSEGKCAILRLLIT